MEKPNTTKVSRNLQWGDVLKSPGESSGLLTEARETLHVCKLMVGETGRSGWERKGSDCEIGVRFRFAQGEY